MAKKSLLEYRQALAAFNGPLLELVRVEKLGLALPATASLSLQQNG